MNKVLLILSLVLLASCSPKEIDKDEKKNVGSQKEDRKIEPMQQVIAYRDEVLYARFNKGLVERDGFMLFRSVGVGESFLLAYCDAMDDIVSGIYSQVSTNNEMSVSSLTSSSTRSSAMPFGPNFKVATKRIKETIAGDESAEPTS